MKKITLEMCHAMEQGKEMKKANTQVEYGSTAMYAYLHGNLIATVTTERLYLRSGGWQSNTTKERLNGLLTWYGLPYAIVQRNFIWYIMHTKTGKLTPWGKSYIYGAVEGIKTFKPFVWFNLSTLKHIKP